MLGVPTDQLIITFVSGRSGADVKVVNEALGVVAGFDSNSVISGSSDLYFAFGTSDAATPIELSHVNVESELTPSAKCCVAPVRQPALTS